MFDVFFVAFLLIFSILCFIEFIVFNEEILLALCFFSFVFFCFNSLSDSVYDSFQDRASKFEADLLFSFSVTHRSLVDQFESFFTFRGFNAKYHMLFVGFMSFLKHSKNFALIDATLKFKAFSFEKLSELVIIENKLIESFRKNCIAILLYPLIFTTTKQKPSFLLNASKINALTNSKLLDLKSFSY